MLNKQKPPPIPPPIRIRRRILDKYYDDLAKMHQIDAFVLYEAAMHKLYIKYNPWMAKNKYGKPSKTRTRKDFEPKEQYFDYY